MGRSVYLDSIDAYFTKYPERRPPTYSRDVEGLISDYATDKLEVKALIAGAQQALKRLDEVLNAK